MTSKRQIFLLEICFNVKIREEEMLGWNAHLVCNVCTLFHSCLPLLLTEDFNFDFFVLRPKQTEVSWLEVLNCEWPCMICRGKVKFNTFSSLISLSLKVSVTHLLPNCRHLIQDCGNKCFLWFLLPLHLMLQCMTHLSLRNWRWTDSTWFACLFHAARDNWIVAWCLGWKSLKALGFEVSSPWNFCNTVTSPVVWEALRTHMASLLGGGQRNPLIVRECSRNPSCCSGGSTYLLPEINYFRSGRF